MLAKKRQNIIQQMLQNDGAVTTSKLMEHFDVSIETIRRDLISMEKNGLLIRVHGGAVVNNYMKPFHDLAKRNEEQEKQKRELSFVAMNFINEGDYIAVDTGSTAIFFAEVLKESFTSLTVVTYSLDVFEILRGHREFNVILCGGYYMDGEKTFYGNITLDVLSKLHMQKSFIFPSAISLEFGICDYQQDIYLSQKMLLKNSDNIYILADSAKFERKALLKLDETNPEYIYITDSNLSQELKNLYIKNNIIIYN